MKYKINKYLLFLSLLIVGCEDKPVKTRDIQFIILEKASYKNNIGGEEYFLKSKDTVIEVSNNRYFQYEIGDTINFQTPMEGFFRGTVYLKH